MAAGEDGACDFCGKHLVPTEKALLVEEEKGRLFCTEDCISNYFSPEVERLEKQYFKLLTTGDLSADERERYAHLRWVTLEEPDEVWCEKTLSGDYRYTLIAEFKPEKRSIWCVCICLFLRGEPSFLYLAFTTRNSAMAAHYRKGERLQWSRPKAERNKSIDDNTVIEAKPAASGEVLIDGLADAWTEQEVRMAEMGSLRRGDDIPPSDFPLFQACLEETLEQPDEVWSPPGAIPPMDDSTDTDETDALPATPRVFHFVRKYPSQDGTFWYIVVARETEEEEEQVEILEAFPTRDASLLERYRNGQQEAGTVAEPESPSRLVH